MCVHASLFFIGMLPVTGTAEFSTIGVLDLFRVHIWVYVCVFVFIVVLLLGASPEPGKSVEFMVGPIPAWFGAMQNKERKHCCAADPEKAGERLGSACAMEVERLGHCPPTVGGRPKP